MRETFIIMHDTVGAAVMVHPDGHITGIKTAADLKGFTDLRVPYDVVVVTDKQWKEFHAVSKGR